MQNIKKFPVESMASARLFCPPSPPVFPRARLSAVMRGTACQPFYAQYRRWFSHAHRHTLGHHVSRTSFTGKRIGGGDYRSEGGGTACGFGACPTIGGGAGSGIGGTPGKGGGSAFRERGFRCRKRERWRGECRSRGGGGSRGRCESGSGDNPYGIRSEEVAIGDGGSDLIGAGGAEGEGGGSRSERGERNGTGTSCFTPEVGECASRFPIISGYGSQCDLVGQGDKALSGDREVW